MICKASGQEAMTYADALTIWVAARERAVDELSSRAAQLSRVGRENEAAGLRAAARILRSRALQERTRAAACRADVINDARETRGRGCAGPSREPFHERSDRGRLRVVH
jgi:hypothetical protein